MSSMTSGPPRGPSTPRCRLTAVFASVKKVDPPVVHGGSVVVLRGSPGPRKILINIRGPVTAAVVAAGRLIGRARAVDRIWAAAIQRVGHRVVECGLGVRAVGRVVQT